MGLIIGQGTKSGGGGSSKIGNLEDLTTQDKSNVVAAINEVNGKAVSVAEIQQVMESLPDGQAVSAQVAINTAKIEKIERDIFVGGGYLPIDISSITRNSKFINSSNSWATQGGVYSINVPVVGGETVTIQSNYKNGAIYALLQSNTSVGTPVNFSADAQGRVVLTKNQRVDVVIPQDTTLLYLCVAVGSEDFTPTLYKEQSIPIGEFVKTLDGYHVIKKAVFMGDSITHGVYSYFQGGVKDDAHRYNGFDITNLSSVSEATAYHGIPYFFGQISRCTECVNLGKRGSGYVIDLRNIGNAKAVADGYSFVDVDFVAICHGLNDYIQGASIGSLDTRAIGSVIGNMCHVVEKILTDNPLCKIVVYSPYNAWGQVSKGGDYTSNVFYGSESTNYALGAAPSGKTHTLQEYIDAIDSVCQYYGIQHVCLSKSNVINRFTIKNIMIDGLHPSKDSYPMLAAEIFGKGNFGA